MPVTNDIELFNFDSDSLNPGDTIFVYNFLNSVWKSAVVQEIDVGEREILVNYEDDSQEWISVDTRKICFSIPEPECLNSPEPEENLTSPISEHAIEPFPEVPISPASKRRKSSTNNVRNNESSTKKRKLSVEADHFLKNQDRKNAPTKKESSRHARSKKGAGSKRLPPIKVVSTAFPRLKFKTSPNFDKGNRKRDKREPAARKTAPVKTDEVVAEVQSETGIETVTKRGKSSKSNKDVREDAKMKSAETPVSVPRKKGKQYVEYEIFSGERNVYGSSETLKRKYTASTVKRESLALSNEITPKPNEKIGNFAKTLPFTSVSNKKIKTLLPKRTVAVSQSVTDPMMTPPSIPSTAETSLCFPTALSSIYPAANALPLNITPSSSGCTCPKQDCKKQFRNEKLLMMHIKHYHQEYSNMLSSMPNVADLAYARTVGENIESTQTGFLERITKLEEDRQKERTEPETFSTTNDSIVKLEALDENALPIIENAEKANEQSPKLAKPSAKRSTVKRLSGSSPSSPSSKVPTLVAQLQEPPLLPPSILIKSENVGSEISVSQSVPDTPCSPQPVKPHIDKISPQSDVEDKSSQKKRPLSAKDREVSELDNKDVVNCTCGYGFDDGMMMMCELCRCWQHASCNAVENEDETPAHYICEPCQFPRRQHSSKKYCYAQSWLKDGNLPSFDFVPARQDVSQKREEYLKRSHEFICDLTKLKLAVRSLQVKIQILRQTPDHPKLYLWAKSWSNMNSEEKENELITDGGPVPEAAINTADCRKHLSEHIDEEMSKVELMLKDLEDKIESKYLKVTLENGEVELTYDDDEEQVGFGNDPEKDKTVAKQTLLMMLRDLSSVQNLKYC